MAIALVVVEAMDSKLDVESAEKKNPHCAASEL
jgi:hypothetical protein